MCFSASASFGAGILLSVISIASLKKVQQPSQIYFGCIPIIFCVQQITEGFLWLALTDSKYAYLQEVTTYSFLFFAQILWPVWIPFAFLQLERNSKYKNYQRLLLGLGVVVSLYLAYCLVYYPVAAKVMGSHISYLQGYPEKISTYGSFLYILVTVFPSFISGIKQMWLLGLIILISYCVTILFYVDYIISVWCFFASVISSMVWIILSKMRKKGNQDLS